MNFLIRLKFTFILLACLGSIQSQYYRLDCNDLSSSNKNKIGTEQECILSSKQDGVSDIKVKHMICVDVDCKESLTFSDNHLFACEHSSKISGECIQMPIKNLNPFQSILSDLYQSHETSNEQASIDEEAIELGKNSNPLMKIFETKRNLPFESLNYGRKKRHLPFDVLNYGKRSCDCSLSGNNEKRALPFDAILYGKRSLPFETLNYGKRAYIPIDGYIMGKRSD